MARMRIACGARPVGNAMESTQSIGGYSRRRCQEWTRSGLNRWGDGCSAGGSRLVLIPRNSGYGADPGRRLRRTSILMSGRLPRPLCWEKRRCDHVGQ